MLIGVEVAAGFLGEQGQGVDGVFGEFPVDDLPAGFRVGQFPHVVERRGVQRQDEGGEGHLRHDAPTGGVLDAAFRTLAA